MNNVNLNHLPKTNAIFLMQLTMNTLSSEVVSVVDKIISKHLSEIFYVMSTTINLDEKKVSWIVLERTQARALEIERGQKVKSCDLIWKEIGDNSQISHLLAFSTTCRTLDYSPVTKLYFGGSLETTESIQRLNEEYRLPKKIIVNYKKKPPITKEYFPYPLVIFLKGNHKDCLSIDFYKKFKEHVIKIDPEFDPESCSGISYELSEKVLLQSEMPTFKNDPACISFLLCLKKKLRLKLPKFLAMQILTSSEFFFKPAESHK